MIIRIAISTSITGSFGSVMDTGKEPPHGKVLPHPRALLDHLECDGHW